MHSAVKAFFLGNAAIFGGYLVMNGPSSLMYKKFLTLQDNSSITSLPFCHFAHTSPFNFAVNSAVLLTIGNFHARKYGCAHMVGLFGVSMAVASGLGLMHSMKNEGKVIAGGNALSAGLVTYNVFKNPAWFTYVRMHPLGWLAGLTLFAAFQNDKAV